MSTLCRDLSPILQLIGQALNIFKISLPIILVVLGIIDIGKVSISKDAKDIKDHAKNFIWRISAAIMVFFIPTLVMVIFGFVGRFEDTIENSGIDFDTCYSCLFSPNDKECSKSIELANIALK